MKCKNFEYRALEKQAKGHPMTTPTTPASPDSEREKLILGLNSAADYLIDKNMAHDASTCRKAAALLAASPAAGGGEAVATVIHAPTAAGFPDGETHKVLWLKSPSSLPHGTNLYAHPQPSALPDEVVKDAEHLARAFHDVYERLAPSFGYDTRKDTRQFDPESANGKLMIAVCGELAAMLKEGK